MTPASTFGLRAIRLAGGVALGALSAVAALPSAYLTVLTAVGIRQPRPGAARREVTTHFAIVVPAHDEAAGIGATLESFHELAYPPDRFSVHVVADNCTDSTAEVVRSHGWNAHERMAPDDPGKGPALNWLHDRLNAAGEPFDAIVVVDADTSVDRNFLAAMDAAVAAGAAVAQGHYTVREPEATPTTSFRYAALACRHHLRPLARCRLGASAGLYGNGMVFRRDVLAGRRWSGHLVEDAEFQVELLLDGHAVSYVPHAVLRAEMPHDLGQAETQNQRWERGRIDIARRFVPALVRRAIADRANRVALADAAADQTIPPLSVQAAIDVLAISVASVAAVFGGRTARRLLVLDVLALAALVVHALAGLYAVRAPARMYRSLLSAPRMLIWKTRLWLSVAAPDGDVAWTRTQRNIEHAEQVEHVDDVEHVGHAT
ncbi:MAG: glycosyltransferase family 2 protein [Ilumatobacter sp.]|uniref:glycosyltransferase family 2 protein n=1 Tax=Ilumatobacter sp. TaxID=1967498 RepID=UPI002629D9BE|nr:glycosyltransferase family 2 protein [Ilumatobacter sp.]MDJ0770838.1 glycosyltransferase family 2 protein [Ilumatobacter sp.]